MKSFPSGFIWGTATSSTQIEGAADVDGKGESIWDRFCKIPGKVLNGDRCDVSCNHYELYKDDIALIKQLQFSSYRFSISWPRVLPEGVGKANQKGIDFYKRLVEQLLKNEISPAATLYHWDLPQELQDKGGWTNRDIVDYYLEYVHLMFRELGDMVPKWITHNEPWVVSYLGYGNGEHAPGYTDLRSFIKASHHLLLSHGKAVTLFRELNMKDRDIGITLNLSPAYPATETEDCQFAANRWDGFFNRWFLDPIFKGEYPKDLMDHYQKTLSMDYGYIHPQDLEQISQPIDFLGINYYNSAALQPGKQGEFAFLGVEPVSTGRPVTEMNWEIHPEALYDLLVRIQKDYGDIPIYITENGAAYDDVAVDGEVHDPKRISYIHDHLVMCLKAIQDGVNLKGYYVWSFLDNFEWAYGYQKRFGIVYVDYQTQQRIPKQSAYWFQQVIQQNGLPMESSNK